MAPKQVYGKRTAAKPSTTYAKFISPSKNVAVQEEYGQRKNRRTGKSKDAEIEDKKNVDVEALVGELDGLRLENDDALAEMDPEQPVRRRENTRGTTTSTERRKAAKTSTSKKSKTVDANAKRPTKSKGEVEEDVLAEDFDALEIKNDHKSPIETSQKGKGSAPGVRTSPRKLNSSKPIEKMANEEQTANPPRAEQQRTPTTPTQSRKLKAVVIPRTSPMPLVSDPVPIPNLEDPYTSYVSSLLSLQSYGRAIIPFKGWSASLEPHFAVSKIAEASFSEVYRLSATKTTCRSMKESVLKLVPLRSAPNAPLRGNSQSRATRNPDAQAQMEKEAREEEDSWKSHVDDVHSEVKLLQNLNYIPGFTQFREITILQGRPSKAFNDAWKAWNKARPRGKKSEFPDPSKKASYDETQLWAVIEMQDAGTDVEKVMEKGGLSTVWEIWDVFWGVCLSVAKAEEACRFEHRDLHLENICIRSSRTESDEDLLNPVIKDPLRRKLGYTGLETTVIDYTLSRADVCSASRRSSSMTDISLISQSSPCTPSTPMEVAYLDLNKDMGLFAGDASEEYQYEIYRYMRGAVYYNDPLRSEEPQESYPDQLRRSPRKTPQHIRFDDPDLGTSPKKQSTNMSFDPPSDIWRSFHPKTNLVWAHFILYKLLEHLQGNEPASLSSAQIMRNVEASSEEKSKVARKAAKMYKVLERVAELLEPSALARKDSLGSMKELVVLSMEERWLRTGDVAGA